MHCMIFTNSKTWEEVKAERSENLNISFVADGDKFERDRDRRCLLKNWKPMDTKENTQKEMGVRMRGKKGAWKSLKLPDGMSEDDIDSVKNHAFKLQQEATYKKFNDETKQDAS